MVLIHNKYLGIKFDNIPSDKWIQLNGLFYILSKMYDWIYLEISSFPLQDYLLFKMCIPDNISSITDLSSLSFHDSKYVSPSNEKTIITQLSDEYKEQFIPIHSKSIIEIYENIFHIPYSLRFIHQSFKRDVENETKLYSSFIQNIHNLPYTFFTFIPNDSLIQKLSIDSFIFIPHHDFYKDKEENTFTNLWYDYDKEYYYYGKIIENSDMIIIDSKDKRWLEYMMIIKIGYEKSKYIICDKKEEEDEIRREYTKSVNWKFIINENEE